MIAASTYWWTELPNWGDRLTPFLLERYARIRAVWSDPTNSSLISLGSILEHMPPLWEGLVAGAGYIDNDSPNHLRRACFLGVRGPLTLKKIGYGNSDSIALGDPGLLADELITLPEKRFDLGILPHVNDHELNGRPEFRQYDPLYINPLDDPFAVLQMIGECRKIVTSSLHGLIVADAFGIPRRFEPNDRWLANPHEGGLFKFQDYHQSVGMKLVPGVTGTPIRAQVEDRKHEVHDMLGDLHSWL